MLFDYSFLRGRIVERYGTNKNFALAIGMNPVTLSLKLQNRIGFKQSEILVMSRFLNFSPTEVMRAFFEESEGGVPFGGR